MSDLFQDRRSIGRGSEKLDPGLSTLIAIYLLILAFLITMHSVSTIELSKAGATMNAVQAAFHNLDNSSKKPIEYEVSADDLNEQFTTRGGMQPFYAEGAKLIQSSFSLEGGVNIREGQGGLFVEIPANRIFIGDSHLVRPEFEKFAQELAILFAASGPREIRKIEIVFGIVAADASVSADTLAQNRLHSLARNLIDQGLREENVIMGIRAGFDNLVSVGFYSKLKSGSQIDFADLKGEAN